MSRVLTRFRQISAIWIFRVFQVRQYEAVIGTKGKEGLGALKRDIGIVWIRAVIRIRGTARVVDGDGMIGDDELDIRVLRGNDLAYGFKPHRAVHLAQLLHFHHEFELNL